MHVSLDTSLSPANLSIRVIVAALGKREWLADWSACLASLHELIHPWSRMLLARYISAHEAQCLETSAEPYVLLYLLPDSLSG